jgi:hypothetical protein
MDVLIINTNYGTEYVTTPIFKKKRGLYICTSKCGHVHNFSFSHKQCKKKIKTV